MLPTIEKLLYTYFVELWEKKKNENFVVFIQNIVRS